MSAQKAYEKALEQIESLHPAPQVLAKAMDKVNDPDVEIADIVNLLKVDASLSAEIIRMSNSAYYGFESESTNLSSAIQRIGFREVLKVLGLSVTRALFSGDLKHYGKSSNWYWSRSVTCALMMEGIALCTGNKPQEAYITGLMHAIGMLAIDQVLDTFHPQAVWPEGTDVWQWETQMVGFNHGFSGAALLKRWNFPNDICRPILNQNASLELGKEPEFLQTSLSLCLLILKGDAGAIGMPSMPKAASGNAANLEALELELAQKHLEALGLQEAQLHDVLNTTLEAFEVVKTQLGVR